VTTDPGVIPPKLGVARTILEGYWWSLWHVRAYGVMALAWAGVTAALQLLFGGLSQRAGEAPPETGASGAVASYAPDLVVFAATFLGAAVISVAAYRLVILDEPVNARRPLRLGRRELRVFGLSLVVYGAAVAEILALTLLLHGAGTPDAAGGGGSMEARGLLPEMIGAVLSSLLCALTLTPFLGLAFPLAAIDAPSGVFGRSFRISRGHRLRLAAIAFIADVPWTVASYLPWLLWDLPAGGIGESLQLGASTFISLLGVAFDATVIAVVFAVIADRQGRGIYDVFD
jgi:hypothetical protein